ncbi:MAG: ornithine carbamoyltransferase [Thermoanaerobaculum sp.]|nr:ornithine carbamoyltransferase [Thermoanaerobaculum sp.]MCX7894824.1 ornithine carbamoyltransferase [Thermoanaerobaculum sp.]MDW7967210.1 ornithine carbamoyltransferase [Thermoanaerobaculum sp.]
MMFRNPWQRHKDLVSISDLTAEEVEALFQLAENVKARPDRYRNALAGKTLAMIFEKASTRTRVSFEVGMYQLGGWATFLSSRDIQIGRGETIHDTAKVLSRYVDGIMARTYAHDTVVELARHASVPVINGLSDFEHPCQALADYFTVREKFGHTRGLTLAYVGDGNNVCHSLLLCGPKVGMNVHVATPPGYEPQAAVVERAKAEAAASGTQIALTHQPQEAVAGAHAVYTDVWASMGQEAEAEQRKKAFAGFQVTPELMALADRQAVFMHCLPCHRGEEVHEAVADGRWSVIFDEAENRLHVQKAILLLLLNR